MNWCALTAKLRYPLRPHAATQSRPSSAHVVASLPELVANALSGLHTAQCRQSFCVSNVTVPAHSNAEATKHYTTVWMPPWALRARDPVRRSSRMHCTGAQITVTLRLHPQSGRHVCARPRRPWAGPGVKNKGSAGLRVHIIARLQPPRRAVSNDMHAIPADRAIRPHLTCGGPACETSRRYHRA